MIILQFDLLNYCMEDSRKFKRILQNQFLENSIKYQLLFETLKLQIQGKTISYAAWKKKEQNKTEIFLKKKLILFSRA